MEKEKQSGEEGSNVYHDFLPLISGESGTIMICQWSVQSHSTSFTDYPERLGQEISEIPTYGVCIRIHGDMLGTDYCHLPWVLHQGRRACCADPRNTVSDDLFWSGIRHNWGNRRRQPLPSWE